MLYSRQIFHPVIYDPFVATWISVGWYCKLVAVFKIYLMTDKKKTKLSGLFVQDSVFVLSIFPHLFWAQDTFILPEI